MFKNVYYALATRKTAELQGIPSIHPTEKSPIWSVMSKMRWV